jgi:hypothetical protein
MLDAMPDVIFEHLLLDAPERGTDGRDLRYDIDAVAILFQHAREAAHLTLDPRKPLQTLRFRPALHD